MERKFKNTNKEGDSVIYGGICSDRIHFALREKYISIWD